MKIYKLITLFCLVNFVFVFSQGLPNTNVINSPVANSLGIYGKIPVSLSRGTVDIKIPIYNLEEGSINVPISLTYNSGGVKVNQLPSIVGLNWTLNAGGIITRVVNGIPDETKYKSVTDSMFTTRIEYNISDGFFYNADKLVFTPYNLKSFISNNMYNFTMYSQDPGQTFNPDFEPDEFIFNFNGYSGRFFFSNDGKWQVEGLNGVEISYETKKFTCYTVVDVVCENPLGTSCEAVVNTVDYDVIKSFTLKLPNGMEYYFDEYETTFDYLSNESPYDVNTWVLTKILDTSNGNYVNFEYEDKSYLQGELVKSVFRDEMTNDIDPITSFFFGPASTTTTGVSLKPNLSAGISKQIKKITTNNVEVEFNYVESNQLFYSQDKINYFKNLNRVYRMNNWSFLTLGINNRPSIDYVLNQLNTIIIKSKITDKIIKGYIFSYTSNSNKRLYLKEIKEKGKNPYFFEYYNEGQLPDYLDGDWKIDHWGYYNNLTVSDQYDYSGNSDANFVTGTSYYPSREPNEQYTKYGSLKKIVYPTGGYTTFEYENNRYTKVVDRTNISNTSFFPINSLYYEKVGGGLRIKKISTYDSPSSEPEIKEYLYSGGVLPFVPIYRINNSFENLFGGGNKTGTIFSTSSIAPLKDYGNIPVQYSKVTEILKNGSSNNGKIEYTFTNFEDYNDVPSQITLSPSLAIFYKCNSNSIARGNLISKKIYDKNNNLIKEEANAYTRDNYYQPIKAIKSNYFDAPYFGTFIQSAYYSINLNSFNLSTKTTKEYKENGIIENVETFTYNQLNNIKISEISGVRKEYFYTSDFFNYANETPNLPNKLIQFTEKNNGKLVDATYYSYKFDQNQNFIIDKIYKFNKSNYVLNPTYSTTINFDNNKFEEKIQFNKYNTKGKLIQFTPSNSNTHFNLWGYNGDHIVAKIVGNITYQELVNALSQINSNYNNLEVDFGSDKNELINIFNTLRNLLPDVQITSYTYEHKVGISSITEPNGQIHYYEYDLENRLIAILDQNANVIKTFEYNYQNSQLYDFPNVQIGNLVNLGSTTVNDGDLHLSVDVLETGSANNTFNWKIVTQSGNIYTYATKTPFLKKHIPFDFYPTIDITCQIIDDFTFSYHDVTQNFSINLVPMYFEQQSLTHYVVKGGSGDFQYSWRVETERNYIDNLVRYLVTENGFIALTGIELNMCREVQVDLTVLDKQTNLTLFNSITRYESPNCDPYNSTDPIPSDCFIAGTKILMSDGTIKNIEDINVGEKVKTYNVETASIEVGVVEEIVKVIKNDFVVIELENGFNNINTPEHPYFVKNKGWCSFNPKKSREMYGGKIQQLEENDYVLVYKDLKNQKYVKIQGIKKILKTQPAFNLKKVSRNHNYFANNILVHNKSYLKKT